MKAVRAYARADLRRRWPAWLALALLLGLGAGASMAAVAGARRTASAFPRLPDATESFDVLVNPDDGDMDFELVERLPQAQGAGRGAGVAVVPAGPDGGPDLAFDDSFPNFFASVDGRLGYTIGRPKVLEGRMPLPDRPDAYRRSRSSRSCLFRSSWPTSSPPSPRAPRPEPPPPLC